MDSTGTILAAVVFIAAAAVVLYLLFTLVKKLRNFVVAIAANSIVGLIALGVLKLLGVTVPLTTPVIISIALFGLGGLGTVLLLLGFGVNIA